MVAVERQEPMECRLRPPVLRQPVLREVQVVDPAVQEIMAAAPDSQVVMEVKAAAGLALARPVALAEMVALVRQAELAAPVATAVLEIPDLVADQD